MDIQLMAQHRTQDEIQCLEKALAEADQHLAEAIARMNEANQVMDAGHDNAAEWYQALRQLNQAAHDRETALIDLIQVVHS